MHNTGDEGAQAEVRAMVEHALADRPGEWRISIVGTRASDRRELKVAGPHMLERTYTLGPPT